MLYPNLTRTNSFHKLLAQIPQFGNPDSTNLPTCMAYSKTSNGILQILPTLNTHTFLLQHHRHTLDNMLYIGQLLQRSHTCNIPFRVRSVQEAPVNISFSNGHNSLSRNSLKREIAQIISNNKLQGMNQAGSQL